MVTDNGCRLVFCLVVLLSGCATPEYFVVTDSTNIDTLNMQAASTSAKVVLLSGETYWASTLEVVDDSTRFWGRRMGQLGDLEHYVIATDQIRRVRLENRLGKGRRGFRVGAATGFIFGFSAAYAVAKGSGCPGATDGDGVLAACPESMFVVGGIFGLGGGLLGAIIGASQRQIQVYNFR